MKRKVSLADSAKYRQFIRARDQSLDQFLLKQRRELSQILTKHLIQLELMIRRYWPQKDFFTSQASGVVQGITYEFYQGLLRSAPLVMDLFYQTKTVGYTVSRLADAEALATAGIPSKTTQQAYHNGLSQVLKSNGNQDAPLEDRLKLEFRHLAAKVELALERARLNELDTDAVLTRIQRVLPGVLSYKRPPREIRDPSMQTREADPRYKKDPLSANYLTDAEWDDIRDQYQDDFVPKYRSADSVFDIPDEHGDYYETYGWEVERDLTDNYVSAVRQGQVDAAREQGINDFVWIAILDDKTDECCEWRHSLTTTEIQKELEGEHADDDCDAVVPPAHFNCRCTLAPAIEELPEREPSNAPDFEEWLNS